MLPDLTTNWSVYPRQQQSLSSIIWGGRSNSRHSPSCSSLIQRCPKHCKVDRIRPNPIRSADCYVVMLYLRLVRLNVALVWSQQCWYGACRYKNVAYVADQCSCQVKRKWQHCIAAMFWAALIRITTGDHLTLVRSLWMVLSQSTGLFVHKICAVYTL